MVDDEKAPEFLLHVDNRYIDGTLMIFFHFIIVSFNQLTYFGRWNIMIFTIGIAKFSPERNPQMKSFSVHVRTDDILQ